MRLIMKKIKIQLHWKNWQNWCKKETWLLKSGRKGANYFTHAKFVYLKMWINDKLTSCKKKKEKKLTIFFIFCGTLGVVEISKYFFHEPIFVPSKNLVCPLESKSQRGLCQGFFIRCISKCYFLLISLKISCSRIKTEVFTNQSWHSGSCNSSVWERWTIYLLSYKSDWNICCCTALLQ